MKVLAVTGGIGCGKSYIVKIFSSMGVPVYYTDDRAKGLYNTNKVLLDKLKGLLGEGIVVDGVLQKGVMAKMIFEDATLLSKVESIVHPLVIEDFYRWKTIQAEKNPPFLIIESAIFLEKPLFRPIADKVLVVTAPLELRMERVVRRDGLTAEQVRDRLNNQWSDIQREEYADYVICSDEKQPLLPQVINIYKEMTNG